MRRVSDPNGVDCIFCILIIFFHELLPLYLHRKKMSLEQASPSWEKKKKKSRSSSNTIKYNFQVLKKGIKLFFFHLLTKAFMMQVNELVKERENKGIHVQHQHELELECRVTGSRGLYITPETVVATSPITTQVSYNYGISTSCSLGESVSKSCYWYQY